MPTIYDTPTATIHLASGKHDLGPEVVGTAIIDLALCHVRFIADDLAEIASGEMEMGDRFEASMTSRSSSRRTPTSISTRRKKTKGHSLRRYNC